MQPHVMKIFGESRWRVTQDKGGLLVRGEGTPIWLAGVIERSWEELDQIQSDMRGHSKMRWISEPVTPDGQ